MAKHPGGKNEMKGLENAYCSGCRCICTFSGDAGVRAPTNLDFQYEKAADTKIVGNRLRQKDEGTR